MVKVAASLALAASLVSLASASPIEQGPKLVKVPIHRRANQTSVDIRDVVAKDKARIASFAPRAARAKAAAEGNEEARIQARLNSGSVTNELVSYYAGVKVGSQTFQLIVDTGSSNTWVGANTKYSSSTGRSTGNSVSVSYGSGSFSGTEYTDSVSFAGLTVSKQSIGVASQSQGFDGVDGILGVGPVDLTQGTVSNTNTVPTFLDNLKSQGSISTEALGVYFAPISGSGSSSANGELTFGGADTSKYSGSLGYVSVTSTSPYSYYWGINTAGITQGSTSLSGAASAIVDTGTTLVYIPTSAYNAFLRATGGTTDSNSGLAKFSTKPTSNFAIKIGSTSYTLTPTQYLVPTAEYSYFGLSSGSYYAWINDGGATAADVNFIIGQKFLESYYSVYDTTNHRVGFAPRK